MKGVKKTEVLPFVALEGSFRDGWHNQNGWIFGTFLKGVGWGGIQKCLLQSVSCFDFS